MLFYNEEALNNLEEQLPNPTFAKELEANQDLIYGELIEKFATHTIEPPTKFPEALEICKVLNKSSKAETIEKWCDAWRLIEAKYDQLEVYNGNVF
jgi:hypothetical protein